MARYTTKLTRKGQMTVPADVRRELGLCEGDRITVTSENGVVTIRRAENVAERTAGIFHKYAIFPPPSAEELREMAAEAWTQDAIERDRASKEP
jgi:AbrB family looped-hinge helix DNA binding protein